MNKLGKLLVSTLIVFGILLLSMRHLTIPLMEWGLALRVALLGAAAQFLLGGLLIKVWRR